MKLYPKFALGCLAGILYATLSIAYNIPSSPSARVKLSLKDRSIVNADGLCIWIHSLRRTKDHLFVEFRTQFPNRLDASKARWVFLRRQFSLGVSFWAHNEKECIATDWIPVNHDYRFLIGDSAEETHTFRVQIPLLARSVSVRYGTSPYTTNKVPIPSHPKSG